MWDDFGVDAKAECPTNGLDDRTITCSVSFGGPAERSVEATLDSSGELVEAYDTAAVRRILAYE